MGVAAGVDAFDGRSASETPVKASVVKGATATAEAHGRAVGEPALAVKTDGTADMRAKAAATGAYTCEAADTRPAKSSVKPTRAPVSRYNDASV